MQNNLDNVHSLIVKDLLLIWFATLHLYRHLPAHQIYTVQRTVYITFRNIHDKQKYET